MSPKVLLWTTSALIATCARKFENFARSEKGHAYVYKQPENEEEEKLCENALSSCPVEAIGSDE